MIMFSCFNLVYTESGLAPNALARGYRWAMTFGKSANTVTIVK